MSENEKRGIASQIISDLEDDISDRAGLGNEWQEIDEEIRQEIREKWLEIIVARLP